MQHTQATNTKVIILLGPPGAGKGSQAALLRRHANVAHLSTGDLLRGNIKESTPLGIEAKAYMDAGKLVPDNLIFEMLFARWKQQGDSNGFILDGFPRNLSQAQALKKKLNNAYDVIAINLCIEDKAIIERITKRQICGDCQAPYHPDFSPSKFEGLCDQCAGELYQRSDDTEEVVKTRLAIYHEETRPLITFYEEEGLLHQIDARADKEAILQEILSLIN